MKALVINGHSHWPKIAEGKLNQTIFNEAVATLTGKGYEIIHTNMSSGYNVADEVEKLAQADFVLLHYPIFWFGMPAATKEYIDTVLMSGYGKVCSGDGRNTGGNYGTGGLLKSKGMIVNTWNAPAEIFGTPGQLLSDMSMEDFVKPATTIFRFIGVRPQPSYAFYDIFKKPNIEAELSGFKRHLEMYC